MCLTYFHYWISHRRSDKDVEAEGSVREDQVALLSLMLAQLNLHVLSLISDNNSGFPQ